MTKASKQTRRALHASINALSHDEVAAIIRQDHPRVSAAKLDEVAKAAIAEAHNLVSPQK